MLKVRQSRLLQVSAALFLAVFLAVGLSVPALAAAADPANPDGSLNLVVTALQGGIEATPGQTTSVNLQIKNAGISTEHLKIEVMKFGAEGEDGTPKLETPGPNDDFIHWVTFSQSTFDAEPNVWNSIKMNIAVPTNAAFAYDYAVVFERANGQPTVTKQANLIGAAASLVMVNVNRPGAKSEAQLASFTMPKKVYEFLPTTFTVRMKNTGNVHVAPRGNIFISRTARGSTIDLLEVNHAVGAILPGTYRTFTSSWTDGSPVYKLKNANGAVVLNKNDKQQSKLDWSDFNPSKLRVGRYTARLVMVYNDGNNDIPVEGSISFWVFPWRILAVLALIVLLMLAGVYAVAVRPIIRRARTRRQKTKQFHAPRPR